MDAPRTFALMITLLLLAPTRHGLDMQKQESDQTIKIGTELVVLDAQVLNKKTGQPVSGLAKEDLVLTEDGVKQQISHFSFDKAPLSIILMLDVSGSVQMVLDQIRDKGLQALERLKPEDEVAVVLFGEWFELTQEFTRDRKLAARKIGELGRLAQSMRAATFIDEAVYQSAAHLLKSSTPGASRVIIAVTDNIQSPNAAGHTRTGALERLYESGATVCGLIVGDFDLRAAVYKQRGVRIDDPIGMFANETGGLFLKTGKEDASARLGDLIDRLRSRYSLGYVSTNQKRDGKLRRIKLKATDAAEKRVGGISIVTRRGYRN